MINNFLRFQESGYDVEEKTLENPSSGARVSIREAVDTGLLDVMSGEIVHPTSGVRYSVPKAVHLKLLQPSAGKRVMEALNLNLSELYAAMQDLSPRSDFSPLSLGSSGSLTSLTGPASTGATMVKEVTWRGHPSELRVSKGELTSLYNTTYGSRASLPEDQVTYGSLPSLPGERVIEDSSFRPGSYEYVTETRATGAPASEVARFRPGSYEYVKETRSSGAPASEAISFRPGSYDYIREERRTDSRGIGTPGSAARSFEDTSFRPGGTPGSAGRSFEDTSFRPGSYEYVREERSSGAPASEGAGSRQFDVQFRRIGGPQERVLSEEELSRGSPDSERIIMRRSSPNIRAPARDRRSYDDLLGDVLQLE